MVTSLSATGAWYKSVLPAGWTGNHYVEALRDELVLPSVRRSLTYASLACAIAVVVGLAAAVVIVRSKLRTRGVIEGDISRWHYKRVWP